MNHDDHHACPGAEAFELLGRKWTAYLVWALFPGPKRFGELRSMTPRLTDRMLTVRLRSLEAAGILTRRQFAEIPVRVEYELTDRGRDLEPIIVEMERWGRRWPEAEVSLPTDAPDQMPAGRDVRRITAQ